MKFERDRLSALSYANGFTLWVYRYIDDEGPRLDSVTFFDDARDLVRPGDMVIVSSPKWGCYTYSTMLDPESGKLINFRMSP